MEWLTNPQAWIALITLTALEIVLGIDNIIFISILVGRLPRAKRNKARVLGLGLAMVTRIALLLSITWVMQLTEPFFMVLTQEVSGRDLILFIGGLFLLWKSTLEIHNSLEGRGRGQGGEGRCRVRRGFGADRGARYHLFAGLRDHRRGTGEGGSGHGPCHRHRRDRDDVFVPLHRRFRGQTPDHQGPRPELSRGDRRGPDRGELRPPYPERVHLFRHGLLRERGNAEHEVAEEGPPGEIT